MSGESSVFGSGGNHNVVPYGYIDKKADSGKVIKFNGDPEEFSWMKSYGIFWKMELVTWILMKKGLL